MVYTALIALLNNQTFTSEIQNNEVIQNVLDFTNNVINYVTEILSIYIIYIIEIAKKINKLEKENNYNINILLLMIVFITITIVEYKTYTANFQEIMDQVQYLKKRVKNQESDIEYSLECNVSNESKINKLNKQIKKLQKEINKYE
jgi:glucan phosphoethanolaminetransferase (alkaline phosphatase superfamily)